jgi:hypothetical protein
MRFIKQGVVLILTSAWCNLFSQTIPLPEHPRPDFERSQWINLNGKWDFEFDSMDIGLKKDWNNPKAHFSKKILVPFPWGSDLSEVKDEADIAWYQRSIKVPGAWKGRKVFVTIGASDWLTTLWLDGKEIGTHQGGYMPFSFDLSTQILFDKEQVITIRVDDKRRAFTLYGKQGYGNARGLWQTIYLEARGMNFIEQIHCTPDVDNRKVLIAIKLNLPVHENQSLEIKLKRPEGDTLIKTLIPADSKLTETSINLPKARLWIWRIRIYIISRLSLYQIRYHLILV